MEEISDSVFLTRKIEKDIRRFFASSDKKCLLVEGARQVGKSTLIEKLGRECFRHFVKIDFLSDSAAKGIFTSSSSTSDILSRLTMLTDEKLEKGETLFFFDEV